MNILIPHYLMHSYLYYERDDPVIRDNVYDNLCKVLLQNFDNLKHVHKHLIDKESLKCGSGAGIKYTNMIKDAAMLFYSDDGVKRWGINLLRSFNIQQ